MSLASKLLEIGKSLLRSPTEKRPSVEPGRAQDSVKWIQRAFSLMESVESAETLEITELKVFSLSSLHQVILSEFAELYFEEPRWLFHLGSYGYLDPHQITARAYFFTSSHDPDNLSRAEASLNELIASVDNSIDRVSKLP